MFRRKNTIQNEISLVETLLDDSKKWATYNYFVYHLQVIDTKASQLITIQSVLLSLFGATYFSFIDKLTCKAPFIISIILIIISFIFSLISVWTIWSTKIVNKDDLGGLLKLRNFKTRFLITAKLVLLAGILFYLFNLIIT